MSESKFKPSFGVETLLSGDLATESEKFLLFMKAYYEWMQTTKLDVTNQTGTFVRGETIIGSSGATAVIKQINGSEIIVQVDTRLPFSIHEVITGQTSAATAEISFVRDNVVRKTGKLLEYRNVETSIDTYIDYLKDELYPSIPITYYGDKRVIASKFREFFQSKSNEDSYRFIFKLLYDDNIDFYYPGNDIIRVSSGKFEKTQVIRTAASAFGYNALGNLFTRDIFLFLNKTIRGRTTGFLANVVDIKKFFIGSREVAEMTLKLVSGSFVGGEEIFDITDENLFTNLFGIVSQVNVIDGGSGYRDGDVITITGDGSEAQAKVISIKESPISALKVNTLGHGYQLNTFATVDNTDTGGSGFIVQVTGIANTYVVTSGANTYTVGEISEVSVINRGEGYFKKPAITLQDTPIAALGLLSDKLITISNPGSNYGVGNTLIFTGGSGANAAGQIASVVESTTFDLLFEDGQRMTADGSYYDIVKNEDWSVKGPIKRIELTNFGTGYETGNLPTITINTTIGASASLIVTNVQGKSANVTVDTSNNITGIGSIRAVEITNFGINYTTANASANTLGDGNAVLSPVVSGLGIREGVWLDDEGKVDYKVIQDSYYYQDYSYVIKSGLTFQTYADTLKQIVHPAGLQFFGEIQILNEMDLHSELVSQLQKYRIAFAGLAISVGITHVDSHIRWKFIIEEPPMNTVTARADGRMTLFAGPVTTNAQIEYTKLALQYLINGTSNVTVDNSSNAITEELSITRPASTVSLYRRNITDLELGELSTSTLNDIIPQSIYEGSQASYGNSAFGSIYSNFARIYQETIKKLHTVPTTTVLSPEYHEYKLVNHAKRVTQVQQITLNDWQDLTLSARQNTNFQFVLITPESLVDANTTISVVESGAKTAQKFTGKTATIGLHRQTFEDFEIGVIQDQTFNNYTLQSVYEGTPITIGNSTVGDIYINYQRTFTRAVKTFSPEKAVCNILSAQEYKLINHARRLKQAQEVTLDDWQDLTISARQNITLDFFLISGDGSTDGNVPVDVVASAINTAKKDTSKNSTIGIHRIIFEDLRVGEASDQKLEDYTLQSVYEGTPVTNESRVFGDIYVNYQRTFTRAIKTFSAGLAVTTLNTAQEYSIINHAKRFVPYQERFLDEYANVQISFVETKVFEESILKPTDLADMRVNVSSVAANNYTVKVNTRTNVITQYDKIMRDVSLAQVENKRFTDFLPQSVYDGTSPTFETSDFSVMFSNYQTVFGELIKTRNTKITDSTTVTSNAEVVVPFEGNGFRFRIYDEELLSDYGSTPISALENIQFDTYKDTVYDRSIKASPSPLALGQSNPHPQSNRKNPTDVFRDEIVIKSQSVPSAYTTNYADIKLLTIPDLTFNDVVPGTQDIVGAQTFAQTYPQAPVTSGTYIKYQKIAGTVSSSNISYTDMPVSVYELSPLSSVYDTIFSGTASLITGVGTNFVTNFNLGDSFTANNEYFATESIANTTFMVVDRLPINSFSGVNAYKMI
jgi:hypothetical protein